MKKNTLLIVGVLGIGGVVAYEYWKKKQNPAAPTSSSGSGNNGSGYLVPPTQSSLPATNMPSSPNSPSASGGGIDPTVIHVVQGWASADGRTPVLAMAKAMIPAEYNGMYDVITNYWNKGVSAGGTPAMTFWDNLRNKYDPQHAQW